jgi:hypothetical protein
MKTRTFVGLLSCMAFVLTINFIPSVFAASSSEQELIQLTKDFANAQIKRDVAFFEQRLPDECTGTDEEGVVYTGKAKFLADLKSGASTITSVVWEDIKAKVWGDAGVVWMRFTQKSNVEGKDTSDTYQETDTWIKINGRWQNVAAHWSKVVKK